MLNSNAVPFFALLVQSLCTLALAAGPLRTTTSQVLGQASSQAGAHNATLLLNPQNSNVTTILRASTALPAHLPEDRNPFFLSIANSPITIKFWHWRSTSSSAYQVEARNLLFDAFNDCNAHPPDAQIDNEWPHIWIVGKTMLGMVAEEEPEEEEHVLTWGLWKDTLQGIRAFIEKYPGIMPACEIYEETPEGAEEADEWVVGYARVSQKD